MYVKKIYFEIIIYKIYAVLISIVKFSKLKYNFSIQFLSFIRMISILNYLKSNKLFISKS